MLLPPCRSTSILEALLFPRGFLCGGTGRPAGPLSYGGTMFQRRAKVPRSCSHRIVVLSSNIAVCEEGRVGNPNSTPHTHLLMLALGAPLVLAGLFLSVPLARRPSHAQTPAILDDAHTLPQRDGSAGPAITGGVEANEGKLVVLKPAICSTMFSP